jgi:hypothetical protein
MAIRAARPEEERHDHVLALVHNDPAADFASLPKEELKQVNDDVEAFNDLVKQAGKWGDGVPPNPAAWLTRAAQNGIPRRYHTSHVWAIRHARSGGLSAKLATNHPTRRRTRKVCRALSNAEQGSGLSIQSAFANVVCACGGASSSLKPCRHDG